MPITDPTDISDCELWLAADEIVGLADGDPVASWADGSGNGRNAAQASSGLRPTYKTGILNSLPVVRFDGTGDVLDFAAGSFMAGKTAGEMFAVVKNVNDPAASATTAGHPVFMGGGLNPHYPWTDGTIYEIWGTGSRKTTGNPTPSLASDFRVYNVISASGEYTTNIDGTLHYTTASNTVGWSSFRIGSGAGGQYFFYGDVAEVIFYSRKLSGTERTDVLDYLDAKWFTPPSDTFTATAALTTGGAELLASGATTAPEYEATAAASTGGATCSASGSFTPPTSTGSAALTTGGTAAAASGQFADPEYTAAAALACGGAECAGSGAFASAVYLGTAALAAGGAECAAAGQTQAPTYSAAGALATGGAKCQAAGEVTDAIFTGQAAVICGGTELAAVADFSPPMFTGTAGLVCGGVEFAAFQTVGVAKFPGKVKIDRVGHVCSVELVGPRRVKVSRVGPSKVTVSRRTL